MVIFLETAELRAKNRIDMTVHFWRENAERIIQSNDFPLLQGRGSLSNQQMKELTLPKYEQFDARRKSHEARLADQQDMNELHELESSVKSQ